MRITASAGSQPLPPSHTQPLPLSQTQPLASTASPQTQPSQTQPLVLQASPQPPQPQPLAVPAGDSAGDDSDADGHKDLDSRAAVGEQSFEEETAQAERQHQGDLQGEDSDRDSEAEERALKAKVAAVVRKMLAIVPHPRLHPAVGGEVAVLDWDVHQSAKAAKDVGRCYSFLTPAPAVGGDVADDDDERWSVAAQNFDAQTRKHDIISDILDNKEATTPSAQGGWCLVDELPDPDPDRQQQPTHHQGHDPLIHLPGYYRLRSCIVYLA